MNLVHGPIYNSLGNSGKVPGQLSTGISSTKIVKYNVLLDALRVQLKRTVDVPS